MGSAIRWEQDRDGVVTLVLDDPTQRVNTLNALFADSLAAVVDRLEAERDDVTGVIVRSAKPSFLAGGDLNRLAAVQPGDRADFLADLQLRKARTRRLERLGRPVVAVLTGAALGGGLELALACHHRIAVDDPRVVVGLPEVTLGLLPGGGGTVRTLLRLGADRALSLILSGARLGVAAALEAGLVDESARDEQHALAAARAWILAHPRACQPWDAAGSTAPSAPTPAALPGRPAPAAQVPDSPDSPDDLDDPARRAVVEVARRVPGASVDDALGIESEALADLVISPGAKATMQVVFFDTVRVRSRLQRPAPGDRRPVLVLGPDSPLAAAARTLEPRVRVVEASALSADPALAAEIEAARAGAEQVVLDVVDGPGAAATDVALRVDRLGDGALVVLHAAEDALADVLPALSRAGALPIAVRPGHLDAVTPTSGPPDALAARLRSALAHDADVDVASVRVCGYPPWTGGVARHLETTAAPAGGEPA